MSAFVRTGKGQTVKAPHFISSCGDCGEPAAYWLEDVPGQPAKRLRFDCATAKGCGAKGTGDVEMRPAPKGAR